MSSSSYTQGGSIHLPSPSRDSSTVIDGCGHDDSLGSLMSKQKALETEMDELAQVLQSVCSSYLNYLICI